MKSIINDLYYGRITPYESGALKDSEFIRLNQEISETKEFFKGMLSDEDYKRLEELEMLYTGVSDMDCADAFAHGFRLASLFMIEIFIGKAEIES